MRNNNNGKEKVTKNLSLQSWENAIELVTFFFTYTAKEIHKDSEALKFWHKVVLEMPEMDDVKFRKEFQRSVDLLNALDALASKFTQPQIKRTICDLESFRKLTVEVIRDEFGEEAQHE